MSAYLTVAGVIVGIEVVCLASVAILVILAVQADKRHRRRHERPLGDATMRMLSGWTDDDEAWLRGEHRD